MMSSPANPVTPEMIVRTRKAIASWCENDELFEDADMAKICRVVLGLEHPPEISTELFQGVRHPPNL